MFKVLHSSAGAGKTHALVKQYLLLALGETDGNGAWDPAAYSHVLALTFTNKAAGEMRDRILTYLKGLSEPTELTGALSDVRDLLMTASGMSAEQVQQRAHLTLSHMLHHWPMMAVSTIDAFMRRVVTPFARDLSLDQGLRMTVEEEYYRAKAVDLLLEEAGSEPALTELLVAACEQLLEDERNWNPERPLMELSKELGKENALAHLAALRDLDEQAILRFRDGLRKRTSDFRRSIREKGRTAIEAIERAGLQASDLAYGPSGFLSYLRKMASFDVALDPSARALGAISSGKWHSGTASSSAIAALDGIAPLLTRTIEEVEALRKLEMRDHAIAFAVLRDLMSTATLNLLDQRLEHLKHEEGVSFFSDLTRKVVDSMKHEPASFLYERLGEKYRHFLIDEFQDTSVMQWHALLPLIENALASGGSAFLVGDAKQAIYRWRNGEARQFTLLPALFHKEVLAQGELREQVLKHHHVPIPALADNHRSARGIIEFNNALFARLRSELDPVDQVVYEAHEQEVKRAEQGYVEITGFVNDKNDPRTACWRLLLGAVQDCLDDGFSLGDIAVLVRTGRQGREAASQLLDAGWDVVSPDGLALGGNAGVRCVMHVLAWSHRPDDEHAALAGQALASMQANDPTVDPFAVERAPQQVMASWKAQHPRINGRLPLIALLCRIIDAIGWDPATDVFLMGLINEAQVFTKASGDDLGGFLQYWERFAKHRSIGGTPGRKAIQVMTVHKAKGLQFPVVILPDVGKRSRGGAGAPIWIRPDAHLEGPPNALVRSIRPITDLEVPELMEEAHLSLLDDLDILYVAFTRPEQRLYASVDVKNAGPFAKALREHLALVPEVPWISGERQRAKRDGEEADGSGFALSAAQGIGQRNLAIRREAPVEWDPADPDPYRSQGRAVHAILARVKTVEDLSKAVQMERDVWGADALAATTIETQLRELISRPELAPFYGPGLSVRTEATLIQADGNAVRPDRIVRDAHGQRILDIKTGVPIEGHERQVRGYVDLLRSIDGGEVSGHLLYLRDGTIVPVGS